MDCGSGSSKIFANLQTFFWFIVIPYWRVYNSIANTSKGALFLPPSDVCVRSFLCLFYALTELYYPKALSDQALSLAPDWILLLQRPRIPASFGVQQQSSTDKATELQETEKQDTELRRIRVKRPRVTMKAGVLPPISAKTEQSRPHMPPRRRHTQNLHNLPREGNVPKSVKPSQGTLNCAGDKHRTQVLFSGTQDPPWRDTDHEIQAP